METEELNLTQDVLTVIEIQHATICSDLKRFHKKETYINNNILITCNKAQLEIILTIQIMEDGLYS